MKKPSNVAFACLCLYVHCTCILYYLINSDRMLYISRFIFNNNILHTTMFFAHKFLKPYYRATQ